MISKRARRFWFTIITVLLVLIAFFLALPDPVQEPETVIMPIFNNATAIAEIYTMTVAPLTPTPSNVIYITMTPTPGIYYPGGVTHHAGMVIMATPSP